MAKTHRLTTYPFCHECGAKAEGEFIVKAFGEVRGVRVALCGHHKAMLVEGTIYAVKPAKALA
jgi:hypothetical protein